MLWKILENPIGSQEIKHTNHGTDQPTVLTGGTNEQAQMMSQEYQDKNISP